MNLKLLLKQSIITLIIFYLAFLANHMQFTQKIINDYANLLNWRCYQIEWCVQN